MNAKPLIKNPGAALVVSALIFVITLAISGSFLGIIVLFSGTAIGESAEKLLTQNPLLKLNIVIGLLIVGQLLNIRSLLK